MSILDKSKIFVCCMWNLKIGTQWVGQCWQIAPAWEYLYIFSDGVSSVRQQFLGCSWMDALNPGYLFGTTWGPTEGCDCHEKII